MADSKSEYDRSVGTWNPGGRLFQIEYAIEAIKLGQTAIGVVCKDGVLLVAEKFTKPLMVPKTMEKIFEIDHHMACATAGMLADARTLVEHARTEAQSHWFTYNEPMTVQSCVNAISDMSLDFANTSGRRKKKMSRPFGVALLLGGVDNGVPKLWMTDPSGTPVQFTTHAIGSAQEGALAMLSEQYKKDMTLQEGEKMAVSILRETMEDKLTKNNVEIATIKVEDAKYHLYTEEEKEAVIASLPPPAAGL